MSETKKKVKNSGKAKTQAKARLGKKKNTKANGKKAFIAIGAVVAVCAVAFLGVYFSVKSIFRRLAQTVAGCLVFRL